MSGDLSRCTGKTYEEASEFSTQRQTLSITLLKAGRSLDAGPNGGRAGARRTPRGGCPPRLASSSGAAHGEPRQLLRGDGPDLDHRIRPRRWAAALSQDYTQSCSL